MDGKKLCILVVDDLQCNLSLIGMILDGLDCSYEFAVNGSEAIEKLESGENFDLVFMDCVMPVMDGREAIKEIRKRPEYSGVKIICMSSRHFNGENPVCRDCRVDGFLCKPVTEKGIREVVMMHEITCGIKAYEKA